MQLYIRINITFSKIYVVLAKLKPINLRNELRVWKQPLPRISHLQNNSLRPILMTFSVIFVVFF